MFKYKSPLSRLLEGAGKAKEEETTEAAAPTEEKPEPIADFNALRAALGGGNLASEAYEETYDEEDELTAEGEMPEFSDAEDVAEAIEEETSIFAEEAPLTEEVAEEVAFDEADADEQIVTLHLSEDERVEAPVQDEVDVAEPEVIEPVAVEHLTMDRQVEGTTVSRMRAATRGARLRADRSGHCSNRIAARNAAPYNVFRVGR